MTIKVNRATRVGVCLAARDFWREPVDINDVKAMLARINRDSALRSCAQLGAINSNIVRWNGGWKSVAGQTMFPALADLIFPLDAENRRRALNIYGNPNFWAPFVDAALAALMALACRYCPDNGGEDLIKDLHRRENLTKMLLSLQQHLLPAKETVDSLKTRSFDKIFPKVSRSILAAICTQNNWAEDLGRLQLLVAVPEIGSALHKQCGIDIPEWFKKRLGIEPEEYQGITDIFLAYAFRNFLDYGPLFRDFEAVNSDRFDFLRLAITTPEDIVKLPEPKTLEDAVYGPWPLWVRPLLKSGNEIHLTSFAWLFNKFLHGFPYLILETQRLRKGEALTNEEAKQLRGELGLVFEGYIQWLLRQWFSDTDVQVISGYYIKESESVDVKWFEKDILLIYKNVAYALEVKAIVPSLNLRQNGGLDTWTSFLREIANQSVNAAKALVDGRAYFSDKLTPIPVPQKVYPIGVIYEALPLRQPFVEPLERELARAVSDTLFSDSKTIGPLQFIDIEQLESWDEFFDLPTEMLALFETIRHRAESILHRYVSFDRCMGRQSSHRGILSVAADEAEKVTAAKAQELSSRVPAPGFLTPFGAQIRTLGGPRLR